MKRKYVYRGGVLIFDRLVAHRFEAATCASTPAEARRNILYQFRKKNGYRNNVPASLTGDVTVAE